MEGLVVRTVTGDELAGYVDDLARLRIEIFRDFPYLYDGTLAYERRYLQTYVDSPQSAAVIAFDGTIVVGASTCVPLRDEDPAFAEPFLACGRDVARVCYFGESLLRPAYRGRGIYGRFFAERERHARSLPGIDTCAFCAVVRPATHPLRPRDYAPLDPVWRRFGYTEHPELVVTYGWKDVDVAYETEKPLAVWTKSLASPGRNPDARPLS